MKKPFATAIRRKFAFGIHGNEGKTEKFSTRYLGKIENRPLYIFLHLIKDSVAKNVTKSQWRSS